MCTGNTATSDDVACTSVGATGYKYGDGSAIQGTTEADCCNFYGLCSGNTDESLDVTCDAGTHLKDSPESIASAPGDDAATRQDACCDANVCNDFAAESAVDGYVLPTCSDFTTGSIACDPLPTWLAGYYGTPTLVDVTCDDDDAELSVSGCTECAAVSNSVGSVTLSLIHI